ncbi:heat shock 70 kDa protein-like [Zophobas morio]|uniref:heat shock 70 kDa protein-like n=1 Tax=Zophobas morio TaxID=2755281 RepID=UPI0030830FFB
MDDLVIGIDLGTTNSCISLYRKGKLKILENPEGERTTPTFIFFQPEGGVIFGKHAPKVASNRTENGIYEVKRLVGRTYNDPRLQESIKYLSYNVKPDESNLPVVTLKQNGKIVTKTPQEVYTAILKELKRYAEEKLDHAVKKAVITVPAYFNILQREVTLAAAKEAGFNVLKLLNEPTAAALAYYFENDMNQKRRCLVYDLGGGTFDIAVLERHGSNIRSICVSGDSQLGGHDLDKCLQAHVHRELRGKYNFIVDSPEDKRTLRNKCEEAKKQLSTTKETVIVINGMVPQHPKIKIIITQKEFEELADNLFKRTMLILDECLGRSNISKESIEEVILCGGSSRIPKVQNLVSEYFDGKKLSKFVNPDECVADGAALQAAMMSKHQSQEIDVIKMVDVVPLSLGFSNVANEMNFLIMRNTKIPASASKVFRTIIENQRSMPFQIYEGERSDARLNRLIGNFTIKDLTPAPPGALKIIATLSIDHNGILTATAKEEGKEKKELSINFTRGARSEREIINSIKDAEVNQEYDEKFKDFGRLKRYLIEYCGGVIYNMEKKKLVKKYKMAYDFCKACRDIVANFEMNKVDELKTLIEKCKTQCEHIAHTHKFKHMPIAAAYI